MVRHKKAQRTKDKFATYLEGGTALKDALALARVPRSSYYGWLRRDAEFARRCEAALVAILAKPPVNKESAVIPAANRPLFLEERIANMEESLARIEALLVAQTQTQEILITAPGIERTFARKSNPIHVANRKFNCQICGTERIAFFDSNFPQVICAQADSPKCRLVYGRLKQKEHRKRYAQKKEFTCAICGKDGLKKAGNQITCSWDVSPECRLEYNRRKAKEYHLKNRKIARRMAYEKKGLIFPIA